MLYLYQNKSKPNSMRTFLILAIAAILLSSCSRNSTEGKHSDIELAEILIYNHQDSFYTNPKDTENHLTSAMKHLKDGSAKGRLSLFIGMARLFQGDANGLCQSV